jgi:hypothetical protein
MMGAGGEANLARRGETRASFQGTASFDSNVRSEPAYDQGSPEQHVELDGWMVACRPTLLSIAEIAADMAEEMRT